MKLSAISCTNTLFLAFSFARGIELLLQLKSVLLTYLQLCLILLCGVLAAALLTLGPPPAPGDFEAIEGVLASYSEEHSKALVHMLLRLEGRESAFIVRQPDCPGCRQGFQGSSLIGSPVVVEVKRDELRQPKINVYGLRQGGRTFSTKEGYIAQELYFRKAMPRMILGTAAVMVLWLASCLWWKLRRLKRSKGV